MRFGVFGPVAVWTADGTPVRVPELKVRALLACLLVRGGRPVSADRLIEDLWGERPPADPAAALRGKVSQLRRALEDAEPGGRELVVHQPPGYLLRVQPGAVDVDRFEDLVARARESADPGEQAELLAEALALWRGPALADFEDEEFARATAARLEEQRLAAVEDEAEARLALGRHGGLAGELGELVTRHPLRERLRGLQLRALYRSGRQGEALAGYEDLRARLAAELGVEPGPELLALHRAILAQDPELAAPPVAVRPRTNLPVALGDLIGRDEAVADLRASLGTHRLVTLVGPGGVGKTRLAMATAAGLTGEFPDGVWVVDLTGRTGGDRVTEVTAAALGVRDVLGPKPVPLPDRLADALRANRTLLVFDNCEQAVEPVALLAARLLAAAPGLRVLATSQEPLGLAGELRWHVPALELPGREAAPEDLRRFSAVRFFTARAAAAAPGFALDEDNAEAVAAICRRLDGLPLALELAANRVRAVGVHRLAAGLDDRFRLLAAGHRDAPARQRTLRATIDWSWQLLTEAERVVLRRLAVVAESCTLAAAEEICAGAGVRPGDVLELLARLVDRSLVVPVEGEDGPRYRLLESVAAYCAERLEQAGELDRVRQRHHRYYTELAERAESRLRGPEQGRWLKRLDADSANLRAALDGAEPALALRLVAALAWYWLLRGRLTEARRSLVTALSAENGGGETSATCASAVSWLAGIAMLTVTGTDLLERGREALAGYEQVDDPRGLAMAEWFLGYAQWGMGDPAVSRRLVDSALAGFRAVADRWGIAAALAVRSTQAMSTGDLAAAKRDGEQSAAIFEDLGDGWGRLQGKQNLGTLAEITGDYRLAGRLHREGLRIAEELGLWHEVAHQLARLGRTALLDGDPALAERLHERSRRLAVEQSDLAARHFAELGLALGARRQGKLDLAESYLRSWLDWCRELDGDPGAALILAELGFVAELRGEPEAALSLHEEGLAAARATGDPRAVALAHEGMAGAHALAGRFADAARLLGAAAATRAAVHAPLPPAERGDVDRITAVVVAAIGETAFTAAFEA
ncbi:BTAD domain-containing putative transcriptional regulator [Amycolatopsis nigrescens]|uniref:BTAD domain-containing putative transcriptional regulator n=1 Tax=Amycolatopsis nigrescens TaxID=381445 RepID=UPI0004758DD9|nr:BTAD domain-containing putative transcriptional regulator [Amycolatopsis nigrescens]